MCGYYNSRFGILCTNTQQTLITMLLSIMEKDLKILCRWPVYLGWSKKLNCRGVFALEDLKTDAVVESCPVILIEHKNQPDIINGCPTGSIIDNYYYDWNHDYWCLPLGYAMLYNHSYQPNMKYVRDFKTNLLSYVALRNIKKDEELTVNYNGDPLDQTPIDSWFKEYGGHKII